MRDSGNPRNYSFKAKMASVNKDTFTHAPCPLAQPPSSLLYSYPSNYALDTLPFWSSWFAVYFSPMGISFIPMFQYPLKTTSTLIFFSSSHLYIVPLADQTSLCVCPQTSQVSIQARANELPLQYAPS